MSSQTAAAHAGIKQCSFPFTLNKIKMGSGYIGDLIYVGIDRMNLKKSWSYVMLLFTIRLNPPLERLPSISGIRLFSSSTVP